MKIKFLLIILIVSPIFTYSLEPLPINLINFNSTLGQIFLKRDLNENTLKLLNNFVTQENPTYCGVASAVMILNALELPSPADMAHPPYHYFTQDNFFNAKVNQFVPELVVKKKGMTLQELNTALQTYNLSTQMIFANNMNADKFRQILKTALQHKEFVMVNFLRTGLKQMGGGHHSPLAAYDENTDRFLLLDVARYKYPAYWVKTDDLWNAVNTKDQERYRGVIIVTRKNSGKTY